MEMNGNYSVLMCVYHMEKADNLREAMNSIWAQTIPTNDFVLVCDGPLTDQLDSVIMEMEQKHPGILHVVRLEKNGRLGNALNTGIRYCRNELVARMDSDDISRPDRCERQLLTFQRRPEIGICSGTVEEFVGRDGTMKITSQRVLPETSKEIREFAKTRSPFNHPCVMFKRSAVEIAGGYHSSLYRMEDYYLWIRMLQSGVDGYNLREPLLWMRTGPELYKRRAGTEYAKSQKILFRYMMDTGFINRGQYLKSVAVRTVAALIPNGIRRICYRVLMRNSRGGITSGQVLSEEETRCRPVC